LMKKSYKLKSSAADIGGVSVEWCAKYQRQESISRCRK
jgi:hypothetical protein